MDSLATDPAFIDSDVYLRLGLIIEGKRLKKPPTVLSRLSSSLERSLLLNHDDKILLGSPDSVTVFDGRSPPEISIAHYLDRIFKYSCCSPSCFVIAHIYIDHFLHKTRALLKPLNVHRLIITTVMLAAKVFDDRYVTRCTWYQIQHANKNIGPGNNYETYHISFYHRFIDLWCCAGISTMHTTRELGV